MRYSDNIEVKDFIKNGFDYTLQVWIEDFIIQPCGHKDTCGCNGKRLRGQDVRGLLVKR